MEELVMGRFNVKLSNGREILGAECLGSIYRSGEKLSREDFAGGLRRVTYTNEDGSGEGDMELKNCEIALLRDSAGGGSEFWLRELSEEKLRMLALEGNVEYLAMMTGVEL